MNHSLSASVHAHVLVYLNKSYFDSVHCLSVNFYLKICCKISRNLGQEEKKKQTNFAPNVRHGCDCSLIMMNSKAYICLVFRFLIYLVDAGNAVILQIQDTHTRTHLGLDSKTF